jgi:hypothetical protein
MGESFGGKQTQKSSTTINPLLAQQGGYALSEARELYDDPTPLPSGYVPISPDRMSALEQVKGIAQKGAVSGTALAEWQKVMHGGYLDPSSNPHLQEVVNRSVSSATSAPVSQYATSGRFGSGAMANAAQDAGQATAARIYSANYMNERAHMMGAIGQVGTMQNLQYQDPMMIGRVGMEYEQDEANKRAEEMRQYIHPYAKLDQYLSQLTGNPLMAENTQKVVSKQPFQWGQALIGGIGGLLSPPSIGGE